jgi:hypothetical protein
VGLFRLVVSNTLLGFQRQRGLPQFQVPPATCADEVTNLETRSVNEGKRQRGRGAMRNGCAELGMFMNQVDRRALSFVFRVVRRFGFRARGPSRAVSITKYGDGPNRP